MRLKIDGRMESGVLVASRVDIKRVSGGGDEFELHGQIQSPDAVARTFMLRGVLVQYADGTYFTRGAAADLLTGASVEIEGPLSAAGDRVMAARITFAPAGTGKETVTRLAGAFVKALGDPVLVER